VSETAEKVGITERSSFIRLYRKEMGITPGQMKTHLKNENT
jgi:AraC-like DNA-binding protein